MLTLTETLEDQRDLNRLCADRGRPHTEIFEQNELYGFASILKRVAGLPQHRPVSVVIPHGVGVAGPTRWDLITPSPTVYSFQREYDEALSLEGKRVVIRGACPLYHVAAEVAQQPRRHGTLFFPAHTIRTVHTDVEYEPIAEALANLPEELKPVHVCVYWADFMKGQHRPFVERGLPVVSAGHMWDPRFPWRLAHLISMHRVVASNVYATHTAMALHLGAAWLHMPTPMRYFTEKGCESHYNPAFDAVTNSFNTLLHTGAPAASPQTSCLADDMLGAHRALSPDALAAALMAADRRARLARVA